MSKEKLIPWGEVGYPTFKRTYSRPTEDGKTEEWPDTVDRVVKACNDQLGCNFNEVDQEELRNIMLDLKGTVAGRFLWQLGTKTVDNLGLPSLQNCAFVVIDEPVRPFTWAFEMLMLGSGVGFNIQGRTSTSSLRSETRKLRSQEVMSTMQTSSSLIPVKDGFSFLSASSNLTSGKMGRVKTLRLLLTSSARRALKIKGFGGTASGSEDLVWGMMEINKILNAKAGRRLSSVDCLDIMNIIGKIVVAGNVGGPLRLLLATTTTSSSYVPSVGTSATSRTGEPCPTTLLCVTTSPSFLRISGRGTKVMVSHTG